MIFNILNGDGLAGNFNLPNEKIIFRECLIDGNLAATGIKDFWEVRAAFIKDSFGTDNYFEKVISEFDKLGILRPDDEVNLWFGDEAFCQVNLWFILSMLAEKSVKLFRVFPDSKGWNCNFNDLTECYKGRQLMTIKEVSLGKQLWESYSKSDFVQLKKLSKTKSNCYKKLDEVCQALIDKNIKPGQVLQEIITNGESDFDRIFAQFSSRAGVYGFGDLQIKRLMSLF